MGKLPRHQRARRPPGFEKRDEVAIPIANCLAEFEKREARLGAILAPCRERARLESEKVRCIRRAEHSVWIR